MIQHVICLLRQMHRINTGQIKAHTHTAAYCRRSKGFLRNGETMDEVQKKHSCQTGTKSLSTSLPPIFFCLLFSLSPCLHLHCSSWRERSVLAVCRHKEGGRGLFFFFFTGSLSPDPSNPCPLDACPLLPPYPSFSAYTSVHLPLQTRPPLSQPSASWESGEEDFSIELSRKKKGQRNKRESMQECGRKWKGKEGMQSEEWGEWQRWLEGDGGGCVGRELGYWFRAFWHANLLADCFNRSLFPTQVSKRGCFLEGWVQRWEEERRAEMFVNFFHFYATYGADAIWQPCYFFRTHTKDTVGKLMCSVSNTKLACTVFCRLRGDL